MCNNALILNFMLTDTKLYYMNIKFNLMFLN